MKNKDTLAKAGTAGPLLTFVLHIEPGEVRTLLALHPYWQPGCLSGCPLLAAWLSGWRLGTLYDAGCTPVLGCRDTLQ